MIIWIDVGFFWGVIAFHFIKKVGRADLLVGQSVV
jgi:hypothetical protein